MEKQDLRIGIISAEDARDKRSWSGTSYRMTKALEEEFKEVVCLGPPKPCKLAYYLMHARILFCELGHFLCYRKRFNRGHNPIRSKCQARFFEQKLKDHPVDIIFAPAASIQIAHLHTQIPICYLSDTTFALICNYYDHFKSLSAKSIQTSHKIEQLAIDKSLAQVFSSKWALDSAQSDYGAKHCYVVKFGANIEQEPEKDCVDKRDYTTLRVLFIGLNWERKGGNIVLETMDQLQLKGYPVQLTVCGCIPPETRPYMEVIPFLNKNKPEDMTRLQDLYKNAHLFFMPTRADCTPIVFCEANAYGLPVITTDTGGISSVIENGVNGYMLAMNARIEDYVQLLENLVLHPEKLKTLSLSSRAKYEQELNWKQWGKEMKHILCRTYSMSQSRL